MESKALELLDSMNDLHISALCVSEHHLALSNPRWRYRLMDALHRPSGKVTSQFNSGPENDQYGKLFGGTGIILQGNATGRVVPGGKGGDPMGRWSYIHLRRSQQPPVTIISVYQVCENPTNQLGDTAWHQQRRQLDLANRDQHPRDAFTEDLLTFITTLQSRRHSIIVGGDWNDWLGSKKGKLLRLCTNLGLVDPWTSKHPYDLDFATFETGQHRIDSVFISSELQGALQSVRYTPGGLLCNTDHRAVIITFNTSTLFCQDITTPLSLGKRSVKSNDRQAVTTYVEMMYSHILANNGFYRGNALIKDTNDDHALVESLDNLIGEAGDVAERQCTPRRTPWYSKKLIRLRYIVSLLRHYTNGLRVNIDRSRTIQHRLSKIGHNSALPSSYQEARILLRSYTAQLRDTVATSEGHRRTELSQEADLQGSIGNQKKAKTIRAINKSEQNRKTWKLLKFMSQQGTTQSLDRLEIPDSWPTQVTGDIISSNIPLEDPKCASRWRTVEDPQQIEQYLMLRNYQHFGQAFGTPFTVEPLHSLIDWTANTPTSNLILNGKFDDSGILDPMCKRLLQQCTYSAAADMVGAKISEAEFDGKIRSWNEHTTTSPSGRHLGRYKALFSPGIYIEGSNEALSFKFKQQEIKRLIIQIMNYCIENGYPLRRWGKIVNTMIFKEEGVYKVHRLRVIHIFEADLNLIYACKWRTLVHNADQHNHLHEGQFGGRPGYEATSMALLEELRVEASFLTRRSLLTFDNDAASCYDRIVINLASLINRKYGLHHQLTTLHGKLLSSTDYKLKTATGVSSLSYRSQPQKPLYGTGQGAGNSPGIWLLISNTLFQVYDQVSHGAQFISPDGTIQVHLGLSGFVDDTNAVLNDFAHQEDSTIETLAQKLSEDAQHWTDILYLSGGKLELQKCSYHALQFQFKPNGTPQVIPSEIPSLHLRDPETKGMIEVPYLRPTCAHKILGHWKAPYDFQRTQCRTLLEKANKVSGLNTYCI